MPAVTFVLSRHPHDEFIYDAGDDQVRDDVDDLTADQRAALYHRPGTPLDRPANRTHLSGLWGTLLVIVGPEIRKVQFNQPIFGPLLPDERREVTDLNGRNLHLVCAGPAIASTEQFTTIERYRTNTGGVNQWDMGYIHLISRPNPYGLRVERGNSVVMTLRLGPPHDAGPPHDGICIRVLGGATAQQRAILFHEAPHVGWLVGCIGPRPKDNRGVFPNRPGNPADVTVRHLVRVLEANAGGTGSFFVTRD